MILLAVLTLLHAHLWRYQGPVFLQLLVANGPHYTKIHQSWSVMLVSVYESWYKHILLIKAER